MKKPLLYSQLLKLQDLDQRYVVCAANKYGDLIICGARHFDSIMAAQIKACGLDRNSNDGVRSKEEQGFIDQYGTFMNRVEALEVATAAGQIDTRRPKNPGAWLCSEDLY